VGVEEKNMSVLDKSIFAAHMQRLQVGASQATALDEISRWISDNTYIGGKPYSYKNHEYQQRILDSTAREIVIRKCSQVGISEMSIRRALAMCGMIKDFVTIYTLPTATFAAVLCKTRVNPVINESPYLKEASSGSDSVEVKQFGNSFLYLKGAASSNAPISIPADCLIHDELDFSDSEVISQYQSRLTHSQYKFKLKLSTPTIPGKGIDQEFMRSRRHFNFVKCDHCGHLFIPDFFAHMRIPGYKGELLDITRVNLHTVNYQDAFVECPSCGKKPNLAPERRQWVCENPGDRFEADGFQVSPFDAPFIVKPSDLLRSMVAYTNIGDFVNFALGLPFFSQETVLSPDEVRGTIVNERMEGSLAYVMGVDLGKICHIVVAACAYDGAMQVVHVEDVNLLQLKDRYRELRVLYRVRVAVIDSLPYTDTVLALQAMDSNLWACVYRNDTASAEMFEVNQREKNPEKGVQHRKQINVQKNTTFDNLMAFFRSGQFSKVSCNRDDMFVKNCTSMRRMKEWNLRLHSMEFKWVKSDDGDDHLWFATSYAFLAKFLLQTSTGATGGHLQLVSSFTVGKPRQFI
jgi:hypothetical protein